METPTLGRLFSGRDNNLNLIRMLAAIGVLISHAVSLVVGAGNGAPLKETLGISLGTLSVWVFFGLSGLLVTRSLAQTPSVLHWTAARALRIYPALIVVVSLTVFLFGPLVTTLPVAAYFAAPETWSYLWGNGTLLSIQYGLPGVFEGLSHGGSVNGSLWTLPFEMMCYALVLGLGLTGLLGRPWLLGAGAAVLAVLYFWDGRPTTYHINGLRDLGSVFLLGVGAWVLRDRIVLRGDIALCLICAALPLRGTPVYDEALKVALVYGSLWLAFVPGGALRGYNRFGDYSYGVYIYAFPVQQSMIALVPDGGPALNVVLSLPVTMAFAVLSWHAIERPALALKPRIPATKPVLRRSEVA